MDPRFGIMEGVFQVLVNRQQKDTSTTQAEDFSGQQDQGQEQR